MLTFWAKHKKKQPVLRPEDEEGGGPCVQVKKNAKQEQKQLQKQPKVAEDDAKDVGSSDVDVSLHESSKVHTSATHSCKNIHQV